MFLVILIVLCLDHENVHFLSCEFQNGLYSAIPHLLMTIVTGASGPLADKLMQDPMLTPTQVRRMLTCLGKSVNTYNSSVIYPNGSYPHLVPLFCTCAGSEGPKGSLSDIKFETFRLN